MNPDYETLRLLQSIARSADRLNNVVDDEEVGGHASLVLNQSGQTSARERIGRIRLKTPGMVSIQISQQNIQATGKSSATSKLQALVSWQSGRGTHDATIDINAGTTFTVSSASIVEVTAVLTGIFGNSADVQCTMSPAAGAAQLPAVVTLDEISLPVAAVASADVAIPSWSRTLNFLSNNAAATAGIDVILLKGGTIVSRTYAGESPILLQSGVDGFRISSPVAVTSVWPICELVL